jgi:hypothetical protein
MRGSAIFARQCRRTDEPAARRRVEAALVPDAMDLVSPFALNAAT